MERFLLDLDTPNVLLFHLSSIHIANALSNSMLIELCVSGTSLFIITSSYILHIVIGSGLAEDLLHLVRSSIHFIGNSTNLHTQ